MTGRKKTKQFWSWLRKALFTIIPILIVIYLFETVGIMNSFLIYLGFFFCYFVYKMYRERETVLITIRQIETTIWGKPLDKDMWDKDELKRTKVKLVWRKPKQ
jgi:DMSO/TMAO reductase YedYZ heme-binding membrane subunit